MVPCGLLVDDNLIGWPNAQAEVRATCTGPHRPQNVRCGPSPPAPCWAAAYRGRHVVKRFSKYPIGLASAQVSFHQSSDDSTRRF